MVEGVLNSAALPEKEDAEGVEEERLLLVSPLFFPPVVVYGARSVIPASKCPMILRLTPVGLRVSDVSSCNQRVVRDASRACSASRQLSTCCRRNGITVSYHTQPVYRNVHTPHMPRITSVPPGRPRPLTLVASRQLFACPGHQVTSPWPSTRPDTGPCRGM